MATYLSWVTRCECCCGDDQVHVEYDTNRMKCATCSCYKERTDLNDDGKVFIRVAIRGKATLKVMEHAFSIARSLGAPDNEALLGTRGEFNIDVPADGIINRIEMAKLTTR